MISTWKEYDVEYGKKLKKILDLEMRTREMRVELSEWSVNITTNLKNKVGKRNNNG